MPGVVVRIRFIWGIVCLLVDWTRRGGGLATAGGGSWRFPRVYWLANGVELFERAAYYGTFIALAIFLTDVVGFTDVEAGWIGALFAAAIYFLPFLNGAAADRMGFRSALIVTFAALTAGYAALGLSDRKIPVILALTLVAVGGAFVKPVISGTVARCSDQVNRARAYSIFYMVVNIGSFMGKTIARPVRVVLGVDSVPLYSAAAAFIALVLVLLFYRPPNGGIDRPRSASESVRSLAVVMRNSRFLGLILITAGFWAIQGQLYASMPKYVLRVVGTQASPEWYANVNPLIVVLMVVPITHLVRRMQPVTSIGIALGLIPLSALLMAWSPHLPAPVNLFGMSLHPVTLMMILGIGVQGFAECFLSPRYLEFASRQAPSGQEGLYMGYCHLNTFFAWLFGFAVSGYLLESYCPDPKTLSAVERVQHAAALAGQGPLPAAYAHAHYIWYFFTGIGVVTFLLLVLYQFMTRRARTS